jgi:flagellar basal body-associated protein FliL
MSDDTKKDDKKKDDKDHKAADEAKPSKMGGLVPIIAGVVVLAGIGGGAGMFFAKSLTPATVEKPGEGHGAAAGDEHGGEHGEAPASDGHGGSGLLAIAQELDPIDLKGNITGSGGTRYLTMQVGIWVTKKDYSHLNDPSVKRLIQGRLEETLKTYQLDDLQSPNIITRMKKDFSTAVERLLRSLIPDRPASEKFVHETTVTSLLTQ